MAAATHFQTVQKIYIAFYQRPADPAGLKYWADRIDVAGGDASAVVAAFATSPEAVALYGTIDATTIGSVVDKIYMALFNKAPDAAGKQFYVDGFNAGTFTPGTIALNILNGATGDDAVAINNKAQVANSFTQQVDGRALNDVSFGTGSSFNATYKGDADATAARDILKNVTSSPATVLNQSQVTEEIKTKIADATDPIMGQTGGQTFTLTTGIDNLTGTAGNDVFNAPISDGGTPTATFGGLDTIDGGLGRDTLNIDFGTTVAQMPGTASVKNVEVLKVGTSNTTTAVGGANAFDASGAVGVETIEFSNAGNRGTYVKAGSASTVTTLGGSATIVEGKALTNVAATKTGNVTVDNQNATTGVTSTGTTLTSVTLNAITGVAALRGNGITEVTLKNIVTAGVAATITNNASKDLTVNLDSAGYDTAGAVVGATVTAGAKAENITVNATGARSNATVNAAAAKTLVLTGSADLTLGGITGGAALKSIDGSAATGGLTLGSLNAGTANVKTGSGKDSFEINATKVTVDSGDGNDTVTLGSALALGSTVNLGGGDDVLLNNGGSVAAATLAGTVAIDGGDGVDTVAASLINATNAKQFVNFERIDASTGNTNLDVELMTGSAIDGVTLNGGAGTVTLQNVAAGAGLTVAGVNTGSLTIGVKGAAAGTADAFDITFAGVATPAATALAPDAVSATAVTLAGIEAVTVASGGTGFVTNALTLGANANLKTIAITGDHALALSFTAANGTTGATTGVSSIDGSAATAALNINLANVNGVTAGVNVKGGSAADTFTTSTTSSTITTGAGADKIIATATLADSTNLLAPGTLMTAAASAKVTVTDFMAGDTITGLGGAATISKITLTNTVQNLDQAFDLLSAAGGANDVQWFQYGSDTYVVYNDGTAQLSADDLVVKMTGTIDLSNATVTAGVLAVA